MNLLLHDPEYFVARSLDQAISKLHRLNELSNHRDDWGRNIYLATKDLEEKYQEDFIRYLANPAGVNGTMEPPTDPLPANHPKIDPNILQTYTLSSMKNKNEYTVTVTNTEESDDEKKEN